MISSGNIRPPAGASAMTDSPITVGTPKRKRGGQRSPPPLKFSVDFQWSAPADDGGSSPRSKVAHKFRGLHLEGDGEGGGGVRAPSFATTETLIDMDMDNSDSELARKRHKLDEPMNDASEPAALPQGNETTIKEPHSQPDAEAASLTAVPEVKESMDKLPLPEGSLQKAYPSINRLSDSKSRARKRAGTPPLRGKRDASGQLAKPASESEDTLDIVDPVRAALTWREDEITIYDPEDEDDDGTGINGVGFKPTPAMAHARVMKRRRQMDDYRKREESDARAKRSQRRQAAAAAAAMSPSTAGSPGRRVRFMDGEPFAFVATN